MPGHWGVALGEAHTLLVDGNGHMLVLVSIDSDDHLRTVDDFVTGDCCHLCLLQGLARRPSEADKTATGPEVRLL